MHEVMYAINHKEVFDNRPILVDELEAADYAGADYADELDAKKHADNFFGAIKEFAGEALTVGKITPEGVEFSLHSDATKYYAQAVLAEAKKYFENVSVDEFASLDGMVEARRAVMPNGETVIVIDGCKYSFEYFIRSLRDGTSKFVLTQAFDVHC